MFLLGDEPQRKLDSRHYLLGQVDTDYLMGKAVLLLWPGKNAVTEERDF